MQFSRRVVANYVYVCVVSTKTTLKSRTSFSESYSPVKYFYSILSNFSSGFVSIMAPDDNNGMAKQKKSASFSFKHVLIKNAVLKMEINKSNKIDQQNNFRERNFG